MKIFTRYLLVAALALVSSRFATAGALKVDSAHQPDPKIWDNHGAILWDVVSLPQEHSNTHVTWDDILKTWNVSTFYNKVLNLNTMSEENDSSWIKYGERGGDWLITKVIDIRNSVNPYITFLYQRSGYNEKSPTGKCDNYLYGPEFRVVENADPKKEIRKPDQLLVELISSDSSHISQLNNPLESDWNIHPSRYGLPPVTGNPALSIFGGGGYRIGFLEGDKDSSLTFDDGLRMDLFDAGSDDRFRRAYIFIPEQFRKNGFIRVRFRVDAEINANSKNVKDDRDDFYLDDVKIVQDGKPDVALNSIFVQNPYSILNNNSKFEIPLYADISSIYPIQGDSFQLKIRIKQKTQDKWSPTPDDPDYTNEEGYSKILTLPADNLRNIFMLPSLKLSNFPRFHYGSTYQLWANIMPGKGNSNLSNDTLYFEFPVKMGSVIAYDDPDLINNDYGYLSNPELGGLCLFGFRIGEDLAKNTAPRGSGQILLQIDIFQTDTVYGFQGYWAPLSQAKDEIEFSLLKESGQPGVLLVPGTLMTVKRGWDDIRNDFFWGEYVTCFLPKPAILTPGKYYLQVAQLGEAGLHLGGSKYRMASAITSTGNQQDPSTVCTLYEQSFKFLNLYNLWLNDYRFIYRNVMWSYDFFAFTPPLGNPAYAHFNYEGMSYDSVKTYTRGSFIPMLRLYMDGWHYDWNNVKESEVKNDIVIEPNPAMDFIEISYPGFDRMVNHTVDEANHTLKGVFQLHVEIFNVYGEKVVYLTTSPSPKERGVRIDVSGLPAGVYFVMIGEKVSKLIKI